MALSGSTVSRAWRGCWEGGSCELRHLILAVVVVHHVGEGDPPAAIDRHRVAYVGTEVTWGECHLRERKIAIRDGGLGPDPDGGPSEGVELHDGEALHVRVVGLVPHVLG